MESKYEKLSVWLDGKIVSYKDAKVPILTHSLQYGSGIFEGIRSYETEEGAAIFRLHEHVERFLRTAKIYSMDLHASGKEIEQAIVEVVRKNGIKQTYIRPFAFYNDDSIGVNTKGKEVSIFIAAVPFGKYFESSKGITCKVSSWHRLRSDVLPIEAKASGNYLNSIIASAEARASGFDEAIMTTSNGSVAEGAAENIFLVEDGKLVTPDRGSAILMGITRDTILKLAHELNIETEEREVHKEELYIANEVFFSGTAAEITPIINIDGIKIGNGEQGENTKLLSKAYQDVVHGRTKKHRDWLTECLAESPRS
ncbi:MAG: branched-chain amino acid transaminase [Candidatus Micrarchaeia archaeon]